MQGIVFIAYMVIAGFILFFIIAGAVKVGVKQALYEFKGEIIKELKNRKSDEE